MVSKETAMNSFKGLVILSLITAVIHFYYAHILKGNMPPEMILLIAYLLALSYLVFAVKDKVYSIGHYKISSHTIVKYLMVLSLLAAVYHWYYAHFNMGNNPPELLFLVAFLVILNYMTFTWKKR